MRTQSSKTSLLKITLEKFISGISESYLTTKGQSIYPFLSEGETTDFSEKLFLI